MEQEKQQNRDIGFSETSIDIQADSGVGNTGQTLNQGVSHHRTVTIKTKKQTIVVFEKK